MSWRALYLDLPRKGNSTSSNREMTSSIFLQLRWYTDSLSTAVDFIYQSRYRDGFYLLLARFVVRVRKICAKIVSWFSTLLLNNQMDTSRTMARTFGGTNDLFTKVLDYKVPL